MSGLLCLPQKLAVSRLKSRLLLFDRPRRREAVVGQCNPSCTTSHNQPVIAHKMTAASAATAITTADHNRLSRSRRWGGSVEIFSGYLTLCQARSRHLVQTNHESPAASSTTMPASKR